MPAERIPDISRMVPRRLVMEVVEHAGGTLTILAPRGGPGRRRVLRVLGMATTMRVHLDPIGSRVWGLIDGQRTVAEIHASVAQAFPAEGDLARRLGAYFSVLVSRRLVALGTSPADAIPADS